jgi:hypothetical protein
LPIKKIPPHRGRTNVSPLQVAVGRGDTAVRPVRIRTFRASAVVEARIEALLSQQQMQSRSVEEKQKLDRYEELGDYLSFLNCTVRNFSLAKALSA